MAKARPIITDETHQMVYIEWFDRWVNVQTFRSYSSFPSGYNYRWPSDKSPNNLTAVRYKQWVSYSKNYKKGILYSVYSTPDQYLLPDNQKDAVPLRHAAMNKAISQFMDGKQQLAADFGERKKTIDMLGHRLHQAYNVLRLVRKGNLYGAVRVLKGGKKPLSKRAAELRLEFVYGWKPLVGSIYDIAQKEFPPYPELYISASVRKPFMKSQGNMQTDGSIKSTYSMLVRMNSPLTASANKLGLINPASVAWELTPFSFVVDWFIPISTYLASLNAFAGFTVVNHCSSYTEKLYCSNIDKKTGTGRTRIHETWSRNIHMPPVYRPNFKNPLSVSHAANALALIRVLRK